MIVWVPAHPVQRWAVALDPHPVGVDVDGAGGVGTEQLVPQLIDGEAGGGDVGGACAG